MPRIFADGVHESPPAGWGGTGDVTLAGIPALNPSRQAFGSVMADSDTAHIRIDNNAGEWEISEATYNSGTDTLSRDRVIASSAAGAKVDFTTGVKDVFIVLSSEDAAARIDSGTVMLFHQSAAPRGWTKDVAATLNNSALRVVTSTAWASGKQGATAFTTVFGLGRITGSHTLTIAQIPSHNHDMNFINDAATTGANQRLTPGGGNTQADATEAEGGGGVHDHTVSMDISYINMIIASKDA